MTAMTETPTRHLSATALVELRAVLRDSVAASEARAVSSRRVVHDLTGQSDTDSIVEREIADAAALRSDEEAVEIHDALRRLDAGTYGLCERCARPIAVERLEVIPWTRLCVACPPHSSWRL